MDIGEDMKQEQFDLRSLAGANVTDRGEGLWRLGPGPASGPEIV